MRRFQRVVQRKSAREQRKRAVRAVSARQRCRSTRRSAPPLLRLAATSLGVECAGAGAAARSAPWPARRPLVRRAELLLLRVTFARRDLVEASALLPDADAALIFESPRIALPQQRSAPLRMLLSQPLVDQRRRSSRHTTGACGCVKVTLSALVRGACRHACLRFICARALRRWRGQVRPSSAAERG